MCAYGGAPCETETVISSLVLSVGTVNYSRARSGLMVLGFYDGEFHHHKAGWKVGGFSRKFCFLFIS